MAWEARDQEIVALRDEEELTFKAIGERYHISASRASQIYRSEQRRMRSEKRKEFYEAEKRKTVSLDLTLGEVEILIRILGNFKRRKMRAGGKLEEKKRTYLEDVEYLTAEDLSVRLYRLERDARTEFLPLEK